MQLYLTEQVPSKALIMVHARLVQVLGDPQVGYVARMGNNAFITE